MKHAVKLTLLALAGLVIGYIWLTHSGMFSPASGIAAVLAGTADRPFVYRYLAPVLVGMLQTATGQSLTVAAVEFVLLCFVGWLWALRWLAGLVLPAARPTLAALLAAGPVCLLFLAGGYVYDPLTLLLITVCLGLMLAGRWQLYAVTFVLLCLTRETAILLPAVWLIWRGRRGWPGLLYQLVVFVAVRLVLMWRFAGNPGTMFQTWWALHVQWILTYSLPNVLALTVYGGALAAALWRWRTQPPFLQAAAVIIPAIFAAYWLVGYPGEIRVCLEAYPVLYLLTWHTVWTRAALPTVATIARWSGARGSPKAAMLHQSPKYKRPAQ